MAMDRYVVTDLLTLDDVADRLQVSLSLVRKLVSRAWSLRLVRRERD